MLKTSTQQQQMDTFPADMIQAKALVKYRWGHAPVGGKPWNLYGFTRPTGREPAALWG